MRMRLGRAVLLLPIAAVASSMVVGSAASLQVRPAVLTEIVRPEAYTPMLVTLQMFDVNANGKVDRVVATFSETLASYSAGTSPWTLANVPSGGTLTSVTVAGTQATLAIAEGIGAQSTAVGSFTVALATNASGVRDGNGNRAAFNATAPADKAGPVPISVGTQNNGGTKKAGELNAADVFYASFSEPLLATSLPASTTITEADPAGAVTVDTLNIPGITNGALTTGGSGYVTTDGAQAGFANSVVGLYSPTLLYVQAGSTCTGTCTALAVSSGTFTYVPAASITDAAGNGATGSFTATGIALF